MDVQFFIVLILAAAAAVYAGRAFVRQFTEREGGDAACGCGSKNGCAAMNRDLDRLLETIGRSPGASEAGQAPPPPMPLIDLSDRILSGPRPGGRRS